MAVKKPVTTDDVLAGPPAEGPTPTVALGDPAPDNANLTEDGPSEPSDKAVRFESPWGSRITVSSDIADSFTELGYKPKR